MQLSILEQNKEKVKVLYQLSEAYEQQDCSFAKKYARLSLNLAHRIDDPIGELNAANKMGEILMNCDMNIIEAIQKFNRAIRLAAQLENQELELKILANIAYANYIIENYEASIDYYNRILSLTSTVDSSDHYEFVKGYIGNIHILQGDTTLGMAYYSEIYNAHTANGFSNMTIPTYFFIADYFLIKDAYDQAELFTSKANLILEGKKQYRWQSYGYYTAGKIKYHRGDFQAAITYATRGATIAENKQFNRERFLNYLLLADVYKSMQNYKSSIVYLNKGHQLKDSLNKIEKLSQQSIYRQEVDHVLAQNEAEMAKNQLIAKELETENDQLLIRSIAVGLCITFIFLFIISHRLRKTKKVYQRLEKQKEQLQKLSIVAASIDQTVMIVGADDRIEWVNQAFEKKFGYLKVEAVNRTPYELLGGEKTDMTTVSEIDAHIFEANAAFETKLYQYAKNKNAFLTRLHISPIVDKQGKLERYIVISHDITEEQRIAENLKELSLVASNTTNSIVILDHNLQVIWVNNSFSELTGLTIENVLGRGPLELYNAPFLNLQEKLDLQELYNAHKSFSIQVQSTNRLTESKSILSMNVTPVFDEKGDFIKYISVATDITDLKNLEEQYESLVEGSADMISELDLDGHFTFVNDVVVFALEYSKEELRGMHFLNLVSQGHRKRVEKFYAFQIQTKKMTSHIEFEALKKNGDLIWVGQRAKLILDHKERVTGLSIVTRDITEQKKAEIALKRTYDNANLLSEIGMQITSTLSIQDIIHQLYENINKIMDASVFGIAIPDKSNKTLNFLQVIEKGKPLVDIKFDMNDDSRLSVLCYKDSREVYISDYDEEYQNYLPKSSTFAPVVGENTFSIIYLPLIIQNRTIGVLTVQSFKVNAYDKFQKSLVKSLATFVAIALENATLYETMEEKISERTHEVRLQKEELEINYTNTRLLSEIGQFVSSTLNLEAIFDELYSKVGQLMQADIFGVYIYDDLRKEFKHQLSIKNDERFELTNQELNDENAYHTWCIRHRKEIMINDNQSEFIKFSDDQKNIEAHSLLFYPMIVEQKIIGVITIQSLERNAYQFYHLDMLKTLASYIGTLIDNEALYNTLEMKVQERTMELKEKNEDITASINYALRLQKGILPSEHFIEQLLPESFVLFQPKDIVSGDFYWVERTHSKILFAVVDCTGHGVPGAMMSIIGRNLLDQAVNEKGMTRPAQILNFLQVALSSAFGQTGDQRADLYDGMDLALCSLDLKTNMLDFAGANNSLHLIQDNELIILKGDKVGISAEYQISNSYTHTEIEIKSGDMIYLSSDGYPDQFGGTRYKKYTFGRMNELFESIHQLPMQEQYSRLKEEFLNWKGDKNQIDDICVMGVRIP